MKLSIITPTEIVGEFDDIVHVRGEDDSGAFGILKGHADFMTSLAVSVIGWRNAEGLECYCAVRGGALTVSDGASIDVATPEAVVGEDLELLENEVLVRFRRAIEEESAARSSTERLQIAAIRRICTYLRADRQVPTVPIHEPIGEG